MYVTPCVSNLRAGVVVTSGVPSLPSLLLTQEDTARTLVRFNSDATVPVDEVIMQRMAVLVLIFSALVVIVRGVNG